MFARVKEIVGVEWVRTRWRLDEWQCFLFLVCLFVCFFVFCFFFFSFHVRLTSPNLLPMQFARVNRVETTRNMFRCVVFVLDSHSDSPWRKSLPPMEWINKKKRLYSIIFRWPSCKSDSLINHPPISFSSFFSPIRDNKNKSWHLRRSHDELAKSRRLGLCCFSIETTTEKKNVKSFFFSHSCTKRIYPLIFLIDVVFLFQILFPRWEGETRPTHPLCFRWPEKSNIALRIILTYN